MDNKEEKPKTEKKGKYVVKDLIFQEAKEKSKKARKNGL